MKIISKLNKISSVESIFGEDYRIEENASNPDGILVRSYNMADYPVGDNLLAVARAGAGVNNIPVDKLTERGIAVFNTPGANANAVKELVICGMLTACRDVIGGNAWINTVEEDVAKTAEKGKSQFAGIEIFGKTLGVIGLGAIGVKVATACLALGMKVKGADPYLSEKNRALLPTEVEITDNDDIFRTCDVITVHVPLLNETKNLIGADAIEKFKGNVILLNMSRGALVDVAAVKKGIEEGKIAKYVVDFPDESVLRTKNIIVFPHLGASTQEAEDNCAKMAAEQLKDYIENGNVVNSVNFPNLKKKREGKVRTCVFLRKENKALVENPRYGFTIAEKGDYVYAVADGDEAPPLDGTGFIAVRNIYR
ncbi:MAG: 3-phosphoglycerate dehydrogenase [Christensenellales bacterium]